MKTSVGRTALEVASGDITQLEVDAITNAANSELWMGSGVAGAIKRAGGAAIEREAVLQGPVEVGEAIATTGQDLKAHWVIHAVVMGPDLRTDAGTIAKATRSALACAEHIHACSIALPAFGTGVGGFPLYECADLMTASVVGYLKAHPGTPLRHVMFVVYSDAARAAFNRALAAVSRV